MTGAKVQSRAAAASDRKNGGEKTDMNGSIKKDDHTNGYGTTLPGGGHSASDLPREKRPLGTWSGGDDGGVGGGDSSDEGEAESCGSMCWSWTSRAARNACTLRQVYKRIPIIDWLPHYDTNKAISDLIAGLTVGLTVIPQGIAYALVAELPPKYGLYSAFMGCFMYAIFGSCKDVTVGPTAIMSLMTAEHAAVDGNPDYAVLAAFLSGVTIFLFGLLQLGFVIDFISVPVTAGFTSAAAISIAAGQVDELLGLEKKKHLDNEGIVGEAYEIFANIESIRWEDTVLGVICAILLLYMRYMKNNTWFKSIDEVDEPTAAQRFFNKFSPTTRKVLDKTIWLLSTARNAVIVVVCVGVAIAFDPEIPDDPRASTFILTGNIDSGLPPFEPPPFSTSQDGEEKSFLDMVKQLGSGIVIIPLISILENMAIAKSFSAGKPIDSNQEMIALGICNVMGSFVSSYPTTGSFSRTAVNAASGVRTQMGGIYTGALVLLALGVLMEYCAYIPKATLAAVIITAVIFSVEFHVIRPMWESKKSDLFIMFVSFMCCLFWALEYGILAGAFVQILFILYQAARPKMTVQHELFAGPGTDYLIVRLDRFVVFPSVNHLRAAINKVGMRQAAASAPVVIDCAHIFTSDYTAAAGFADMARDFRRRGQTALFMDMSPGVRHTYKGPDHDGEIKAVRSGDQLREALEEIFANRMEEGAGSGDGLPASAPVDPLLYQEGGAVGGASASADNDDDAASSTEVKIKRSSSSSSSANSDHEEKKA